MPRTYVPTGRPRGRPPGSGKSRKYRYGPDLVYGKPAECAKPEGRRTVFAPVDLRPSDFVMPDSEASLTPEAVAVLCGASNGCYRTPSRGGHE